MEDGLSNNEVYGVIQDRQGYMWFSTGDGLDRYDGYTFRVFRHDPGNLGSVSGNFARALYEDPEGRIWVGTFSDGLNLYDPKTGDFKHYRHIAGDPNSLISDNLWALNSLPDGRLLIGTRDAGLDILDPKTGRFQHFSAGSGPQAPSNSYIERILVDREGHVWLATRSGLDEYDPSGKNPTRYIWAPGGGDGNDIISIAEDGQGRLWLATKAGPYVYTPGDTALSEIPGLTRAQDPMAGKFLYSVFVDSHQDVWYGGEQSGLYLIRHGDKRVFHYQHEPGNHGSLSSNAVQDIFEDRAGYIWACTTSGTDMLNQDELDIYSFKPSQIGGARSDISDSIFGLYQYKNKLLLGGLGAIYQLELTPGSANEERVHEFINLDPTQYGDIRAITGEDKQNLLIGTAHGYLLRINPKRQILKIWRPDVRPDVRSPIINDIKVLHGGEIYLATFGHGLLDFNPQTDRTEQIGGNSRQELSATDIVESLLQSTPNKIWAGTFRGLFEVDTTTKRSVLIPIMPGDTEPVIQGLYEDAKQTLWVATYEGLWHLELDADGNPVSQPQAVSQFNHAQILSIQPDAQGNLWLASVNKLIRFDPSTGVTLSYGREQGSPMSEYFSYGHARSSDGRLWFAGGQGVLGFQPDTLHPNSHAPQVVLNGVTSYRDGKPLFTTLQSGAPLTLSYQDSISIFDVAATDYGAPQANAYSYRLLGFQSEWTPPNAAHQITFTNLNPGRYRLEVKGANNWGIWSIAPAIEDIVVLPPWWRTWWAYTLYLLIVIGSSIAYVYSLKRKIEREQEISTNLREANEIKSNFVERLESQVRKATQELRETLQGVNLKNAELEIAQKRAAEAEQIKSQFLANMSHELRTPLTGVLGYTKLLGSTHLNSEQKDYVGTIKQSSETLLAIINDTLDLSRLEAGKLLIDQVDFDLLEVIESTLELLAPTAYQKRLELVRIIPADVPLYLRGDPLRLRQILTNLLSNAIKFTEHGSVAIEVKVLSQDERETKLVFNISDTGIGIPSGELPKLFHAYARSRISTQHHVEGTGLGLAICKKLLDLMAGDIKVTSKVGTGTSFEFQLTFRVQKNAEPRSRLPRKIKVLLYDAHPLSNQAWRACLMRLGAEVEIVPNLESVVSLKADAAIMVLSEKELTQLGELKRTLTPVLPPMLILAPRIERQALKDLSETLFHRVLSKTAREKTLYLELQSLLQTVVQDGDTTHHGSSSHVEPAADAPKILVADDNRINRRLLVTMLNHAGFRVSEAANGLELLDLAAKGPWDAALLDIHMPGMDGIEAAKRLRESLGDALPPVIAMSADVMPETRKQVMEGIMDDFMVKPFSEQELVDKLRWHLDRHHRKKRTTPQDV
ncbi:MAG TPA: two-component regulator propeller domain-containing protein [Gammaproteobacteria bacterium]|nr:two-component regulator propeller domain-containing protein [Gammaproteobacteria bacterium]